MNDVVNCVGAILLYFFCTQILSMEDTPKAMEITTPADDAISQLTPESSKKELAAQPPIYILDSTPPIPIGAKTTNKTEQKIDDDKKKQKSHFREMTRTITTSENKVFRRRLTTTNEKKKNKQIKKPPVENLVVPVHQSANKLSIEIPIQYSLRYSQINLIDNSDNTQANNNKGRPLLRSREASQGKIEKRSPRQNSDGEPRKQTFLDELSTRIITDNIDLVTRERKESPEIKWSRPSSEPRKESLSNGEGINYFDAHKKKFLDDLSASLRNATVRDTLIYTYPLFVDDVSFLEALQDYADKEDDLSENRKLGLKEKTWLLEELLHSFAVQGVFLGYPSTNAVLELESLLNKLEDAHERIKIEHDKMKANHEKKAHREKIKSSDYEKTKGDEKNIVKASEKIKGIDNLRRRIWLALDAKNRTTKGKTFHSRTKSNRNIYEELEALVPNDAYGENDLLPESFLYKKRRIIWANEKYIAQLMTLRDSNLFRAISVQHILSWAKKGTQTASITKLDEVFHTTVSFLELLLICEKSETRLWLAEKYVAIAEELYQLHNFIGLSQIIIALKSPETKRLLKWEQSKAYQKFLWLEAIVSPVNNFHKYKLEMDKLVNGEHFLPLLSDLWHDLNLLFETKPASIGPEWLGALGQHLSTIQQWQSQSSYDITLLKETINFMEEVSFVPPDVLEEFADLAEPCEDRVKVLPPPDDKLVTDWTFAELKAFLLEKKLDVCIMPLLMNQIWSGRALFDLLANDQYDLVADNRRDTRHILVGFGCPKEEANTLLMLIQLNTEILK